VERKPDLRPIAACVVAGLCLVAGTVFVRRIAAESLGNLPAGEAAAYAAAFVFAASAAARYLTGEAGDAARHAGGAAAFVVTLCFAAGLTTSPVGVLACVVSSGAIVALLTLPAFDASSVAGGAGTDAARNAAAPLPEATMSRLDEPAGGDRDGADETPPASRFFRSTRDGLQIVEGTLRFDVPAGECVQTLHVPLWPPLDGAPAVTCELDGLDGRVRVPLAKPYGFRIEVRLPEPVDEPLSGAVRFVAECPAAANAA